MEGTRDVVDALNVAGMYFAWGYVRFMKFSAGLVWVFVTNDQ